MSGVSSQDARRSVGRDRFGSLCGDVRLGRPTLPRSPSRKHKRRVLGFGSTTRGVARLFFESSAPDQRRRMPHPRQSDLVSINRAPVRSRDKVKQFHTFCCDRRELCTLTPQDCDEARTQYLKYLFLRLEGPADTGGFHACGNTFSRIGTESLPTSFRTLKSLRNYFTLPRSRKAWSETLGDDGVKMVERSCFCA